MQITLRRVIKNTVKVGGTLRKLNINSYILMAGMLFLALPIATAQTNPELDGSQSVYKARLNNTGKVLELDKNLSVEKIESRNSENIRIENEKKAEITRKAVLARSTTTKRYTHVTPFIPTEVSGDVKRQLVIEAANVNGIPWQLLEAVWQVESGKSWNTSRSSYAGAQGPMQFMPGTWRKYATDADGDGQANIWSAPDSVYGGAKLLALSGANRGDYRSALFSYNHANWYVEKVLKIARSLGLE